MIKLYFNQIIRKKKIRKNKKKYLRKIFDIDNEVYIVASNIIVKIGKVKTHKIVDTNTTLALNSCSVE